jgi:hypothetical protein
MWSIGDTPALDIELEEMKVLVLWQFGSKEYFVN